MTIHIGAPELKDKGFLYALIVLEEDQQGTVLTDV